MESVPDIWYLNYRKKNNPLHTRESSKMENMDYRKGEK